MPVANSLFEAPAVDTSVYNQYELFILNTPIPLGFILVVLFTAFLVFILLLLLICECIRTRNKSRFANCAPCGREDEPCCLCCACCADCCACCEQTSIRACLNYCCPRRRTNQWTDIFCSTACLPGNCQPVECSCCQSQYCEDTECCCFRCLCRAPPGSVPLR